MTAIQHLKIDDRSTWELQYIDIRMENLSVLQWNLHLLENGGRIHSNLFVSEQEAKAAVVSGQTNFEAWDTLPDRAQRLAQCRWVPAN